MNFTNGHNVFNDIPGFDASRGEHIVKALQKLWEKIEYLEQVRISEKKSRSKNSQDEDLTITEVQYKLLVLQLQYVRSVLKKKSHADFPTNENDGEQNAFLSDRNYSEKEIVLQNLEDKTVSQGIKSGNTSVHGLNPVKDSDNACNSKLAFTKVSPDGQSKQPSENSGTVIKKTSPTSLKLHYHLKLDDVPFILGASSTASHSVIANVQNIIARMKSHHRVLCGPKRHISRSSVNQCSNHSAETDLAEGDSQDTTKQLCALTNDLRKIVLKQQTLAKELDSKHGKKEISNLNKNSQRDERVNKNSNKYATNVKARRQRSNSESEVKLQAEVKNLHKKDFVRRNIQQKHNFSNLRSQTSNLSILDRRNLLRSLQNFKTHLSEEDISWD